MSKQYDIIVSRRAEHMLLIHVGFLARVSIKAARGLRNEYANMLTALENNPFQFPVAEDMDLPEEYRKALFGKRYYAVFYVEDKTVYLDTVLDCRMDPSGHTK